MERISGERTRSVLCEKRAGLVLMLVTGMLGMVYLGYQVLHVGL